jgi:hypothetical protein
MFLRVIPTPGPPGLMGPRGPLTDMISIGCLSSNVYITVVVIVSVDVFIIVVVVVVVSVMVEVTGSGVHPVNSPARRIKQAKMTNLLDSLFIKFLRSYKFYQVCKLINVLYRIR